jgi:NAD(P)-dependent dehydrogenase (short-subunit alcohol dehydrogenase family)
LLTCFPLLVLDIVVSVGFVYSPPGAVTQSSLADLHKALDEGLPQLFLIAREFLPAIKNREGSTFTLVSGGFAYACPAPNYWTGTLKNAALNALTLGLVSELKDDKVRLNNLCIGVGVAPLDGDKNQFGWPSLNTKEVGKLFVSIVKGAKRGEIINVQKNEQVAELEKSLAAH